MICFVFKPRRRINGSIVETRYYSGKIRMEWEHGAPDIIALKTTDKREAERLLNAERITREKRNAGCLPPKEQQDAQDRPLNELLEAFLDDLRVLGRSAGTIKKYGNMRVMHTRCGWKTLRCVTPRSFCDWRARSGMSPKSLNDLLKNTGTFFGWLRRQRMVAENPLEFVASVETRRREKYRRALTEAEVQRLIEKSPRQRAVIYLLAVYTGLRRNELGQLTVEDFVFDSPAPFVRVRASISKNPKESQQRLRPEVVEAVRSILPMGAPSSALVFKSVPRVRTFMKDLEAAEIPFEDLQGRRADFHALRDTFGTHLAASGAAPFVLKELMRHSTVQQSEKYYIDASQLPLASAVASLPNFRIKPLSLNSLEISEKTQPPLT